MLYQAEQVGTGGDEYAAQLLVVEPIGLLQHRFAIEVEEWQSRIQLARIIAWHGSPLRLSHPMILGK
jgi:hypothetical protein